MDKLIITESLTIKDTAKILDETGKKILLIVENKKLVGVVTDGDIRRWILKNGDFNVSVGAIMNTSPKTIYAYQRSEAKQFMLNEKIQAVPIVEGDRVLKDIIFLDELLIEQEKKQGSINVPVVIMAGGKGTRLYPYTRVLPKPLIPIGEKTIIERIIENFNSAGCKDFYLTVNYKKNMIKAYLDEREKNYKVSYVEEENFLGTAGSLYLLKDQLKETFFVSNCDILVDANYEDLISYHKKNKYKITMVTTLKNYTIPYGVIKNTDEGCIESIEEKPEYSFQVNAGIYILEPEVLEDIPEGRMFHITELINSYMKSGKKVGVYPVMEHEWMDMGEIKEMELMLEKLGLKEG